MGADMILSTAWMKKNQTPDVGKGENLIAKLSKMPLKKWPEAWRESNYDATEAGEDPEEHAVQLKEDLDQFTQATVGRGRRDVTWIEVGPYKIYITGGLSWGDPPTDAMMVFDRLDEAGVLDAMGFFRK